MNNIAMKTELLSLHIRYIPECSVREYQPNLSKLICLHTYCIFSSLNIILHTYIHGSKCQKVHSYSSCNVHTCDDLLFKGVQFMSPSIHSYFI